MIMRRRVQISVFAKRSRVRATYRAISQMSRVGLHIGLLRAGRGLVECASRAVGTIPVIVDGSDSVQGRLIVVRCHEHEDRFSSLDV